MNKTAAHQIGTAFVMAFLLTFGLVQAQTPCDDGRFNDEVFQSFTLTSDVTFGSNINLQGSNQSLEMDIRVPAGDTMLKRPLIVMAHGGSFLFGDKTQNDIVPMAETFAKRGYVTASIEYRLGMEGIPTPGPDSTSAMEAVLRAVHDAKAAVRFFYKDAMGADIYGIDTNKIFFMGSSAGAFIGLHYAYLDQWSEVPSDIDTSKASLSGGMEGSSGNPGYSSKIHGVVSYSGAIGDSSWLVQGDIPLISLHGTADAVVPYGSATIVLIGIYSLMEVDGSESIHKRASAVGMNHCFYTFPGADHVPYVGNVPYTDTTLNLVVPFFLSLVCGGTANCQYLVSAEEELTSHELLVYPNPANDRVRISTAKYLGIQTVELLDELGRNVYYRKESEQEFNIELNNLPPGLYVVKISSLAGIATAKLLKH